MTDVALAPEDVSFVEAEVASGRFRDREGVIRAALASLREAREGQARAARFDALMDDRLADLDAGRFADVDPDDLESWLKGAAV